MSDVEETLAFIADQGIDYAAMAPEQRLAIAQKINDYIVVPKFKTGLLTLGREKKFSLGRLMKGDISVTRLLISQPEMLALMPGEMVVVLLGEIPLEEANPLIDNLNLRKKITMSEATLVNYAKRSLNTALLVLQSDLRYLIKKPALFFEILETHFASLSADDFESILRQLPYSLLQMVYHNPTVCESLFASPMVKHLEKTDAIILLDKHGDSFKVDLASTYLNALAQTLLTTEKSVNYDPKSEVTYPSLLALMLLTTNQRRKVSPAKILKIHEKFNSSLLFTTVLSETENRFLPLPCLLSTMPSLTKKIEKFILSTLEIKSKHRIEGQYSKHLLLNTLTNRLSCKKEREAVEKYALPPSPPRVLFDLNQNQTRAIPSRKNQTQPDSVNENIPGF